MPPETIVEPPAKPKRGAWMSQSGRKDETSDPWPEIKAAVEAGMTILKASKRFGVPYERAKKRAQREGWHVPFTQLALAREKALALGIDVPQMSLAPSEAGKLTPEGRAEVGTALLEDATELAQSASLTGLKLVSGLLKDAAKSPERLSPLVDVKDISQAIRAARLAGNLDKQQAQISLNLWGQASSNSGTSRDIAGDIRDIVEGADE